jgi:hypothetical protein
VVARTRRDVGLNRKSMSCGAAKLTAPRPLWEELSALADGDRARAEPLLFCDTSPARSARRVFEAVLN